MADSAARFTKMIDLRWRSLAIIGGIGFVVGALTWLISLLLQVTVIEPLFCRSADSFNACANGGNISITAALIVANLLGLIALVRAASYRPLLVVIAAILSLWGIQSFLGAMAWWEATLWLGLLFAITYALYAWIARLLSFPLALVTMIVSIVLIRLFIAQL